MCIMNRHFAFFFVGGRIWTGNPLYSYLCAHSHMIVACHAVHTPLNIIYISQEQRPKRDRYTHYIGTAPSVVRNDYILSNISLNDYVFFTKWVYVEKVFIITESYLQGESQPFFSLLKTTIAMNNKNYDFWNFYM